jgi:hypothetical protein
MIQFIQKILSMDCYVEKNYKGLWGFLGKKCGHHLILGKGNEDVGALGLNCRAFFFSTYSSFFVSKL